MMMSGFAGFSLLVIRFECFVSSHPKLLYSLSSRSFQGEHFSFFSFFFFIFLLRHMQITTEKNINHPPYKLPPDKAGSLLLAGKEGHQLPRIAAHSLQLIPSLHHQGGLNFSPHMLCLETGRNSDRRACFALLSALPIMVLDTIATVPCIFVDVRGEGGLRVSFRGIRTIRRPG